MLRSYLRANHGEADKSTGKILRFSLKRIFTNFGELVKNERFRCVSDLPTIMRLRNRIIEEGERINQVIF